MAQSWCKLGLAAAGCGRGCTGEGKSRLFGIAERNRHGCSVHGQRVCQSRQGSGGTRLLMLPANEVQLVRARAVNVCISLLYPWASAASAKYVAAAAVSRAHTCEPRGWQCHAFSAPTKHDALAELWWVLCGDGVSQSTPRQPMRCPGRSGSPKSSCCLCSIGVSVGTTRAHPTNARTCGTRSPENTRPH